ncbi:MAG TPA: ATP-binding protein, partial [Chthoniobacterales bacterium]|nr:ATP-binding protein [Chthoniobacterales bacterium]
MSREVGESPSNLGEASPGRWITEEELRQLQGELRDAKETLEAIRNGEVDAIVVTGDRVYSLAGAEHPYRVYVEQMHEGAVTVAADGLILYCNQRFADMVGAPLEAVIGSAISTSLSPESWEKISAVVSSPESAVKHESVLRRRNGEEIPVNLSASKLCLADQNVICLVVTDLTLQKVDEELRLAKEVAERANLAKDGFLATLSHELRTPLTPALMAVSTLQQDQTLSPRVQADLAMIRRNIVLETRLIDDLLDLTRIANNRLELVEVPLALHRVLQNSIDICVAGIEAKSLDLSLDLNANLSDATGDIVRLQQVFWNVIRNATKFTPIGGAIRISTSNPQPDQFRVTVADSGIGFDPADAEKLFESFRQVGDDVTRRNGGLGLGLAISRAIVNAHGGRIWAESSGVNLGATFYIELPLRKAASPTIPEIAPAVPASAGLRILLVEDHEDTRHVFQAILSQKGHAVQSAATGEAALALASSERFDLVISDLGLPDFNGTDLMSILRERYSLRGVALSGYGMEEDIRRSKSAGFDHHLTKPVDPTKLDQLLANLTKEIRPKVENAGNAVIAVNAGITE